MTIWTRLLAGGAMLSALLGGAISPANAPRAAWPTASLVEVVTGLAHPVQLTHAGDGSGRSFIVEQDGHIRILKDGALLPAAFLDISDRVLYSGEQGLLGLAFPPGYAQKGYFYVYYTRTDGSNQVSRFTIGASPDSANPSSEESILLLEHPGQTNHNGGQLAFGADGTLFIGAGDGGGSGDPAGNAQNPKSLLGKLLRIAVEPPPSGPAPNYPFRTYLPLARRSTPNTAYRIPADNPFVGQAGHRPEIWALGLRNPWRFAFDRSTHDLYIADVGQNRVEEVDFVAAGSPGGMNFGWNTLEGSLCFNPPGGCSTPAGYAAPVAEYSHSEGCSITGGYVYRGAAHPSASGIYFYADFCQGKLWGLQRSNGSWVNQLLLDTDHRPIAFGEDAAGELYLLTITGAVYRLTF
ncbi:MAG: PQQ-dependent sugar dehydrogenase [Chloroflexota bacterium]